MPKKKLVHAMDLLRDEPNTSAVRWLGVKIVSVSSAQLRTKLVSCSEDKIQYDLRQQMNDTKSSTLQREEKLDIFNSHEVL